MANAEASVNPKMVESPRVAVAEEHGHSESGGEQETHGKDWLRVAFVAVILLVVWSGLIPRYHGIDVIGVMGILIGGFPIFEEAISDLVKGRMTMELSMTIALVAASVIGEFLTALLITVFVLIAEILEGLTVGESFRQGRDAGAIGA